MYKIHMQKILTQMRERKKHHVLDNKVEPMGTQFSIFVQLFIHRLLDHLSQAPLLPLIK